MHVSFFCLFVWPSWPQTFWAVRNHGDNYMLHNLTANYPVAAWCCGSLPHRPALPQCSISRPSRWDQRAEAAAFPSYVSSVQADDACFTSRISEHEVMWAAMALKSRVGFKRWLVENLGWATWSCLMGMSAMGQHCWANASLRDGLPSLCRKVWA